MIAMQENRGFDHCHGSLRGVRGFADRATSTLPDGLDPVRRGTDDVLAVGAGWRRCFGTGPCGRTARALA
ncbi:hypothetical protein, partial [Streptomyces sp. NPDC093544]|uniref:hypothetical protein n=1 Tax=Streptomyces sp. NPDC093544 TaxID=3155200 RepID=UPI0034213D72